MKINIDLPFSAGSSGYIISSSNTIVPVVVEKIELIFYKSQPTSPRYNIGLCSLQGHTYTISAPNKFFLSLESAKRVLAEKILGPGYKIVNIEEEDET